MKTSLALLVACILATSGHTSATASGSPQTLAVGQRERLRSKGAPSESQSLLSRTEAIIGEEMLHSEPGPVRRFLGFLAVNARIPLPTVGHQKKPGNGYSPGSPMFNDQEAWVARNGDNVRVGGNDFAFDWVQPPWRDFWVNFYYHPVRSFFAMFLQILLWVLLAYLYIHFAAGWRRTRFLEQVQTQQDFLHTPFDVDCVSGRNQFDWEICGCAFFCPCIRWADTVSSLKMFPGTFWAAFLGLVVLFWLLPLSLGFAWLAMPLVGVYFRQQMRKKFSHEAGKPWTWVYDTVLWCCCPCCAIAQEAREVEKVEPALVRKTTAYSTY